MIVVGVATPTGSAGALRWAATEAALRHEPLRIVHVADEGDTTHRYLETFVDAVLGATPYVGTTVTVESGPAPRTMLRYAEEARLVVVGRPLRAVHPGRTGVVGALLDASPAPVAVVPQATVRTQGDEVLLGVEDSPDGYAATYWAVREAALREATLHAIHAVPLTSLVASGVGSVAVAEAAVGAATERLDVVVGNGLRAVGERVPLYAEVVLAPAHESLVAASRHAALLVVGTSHRGHVSRLVRGSTSRRCADRAACPVVVVPARPVTVPVTRPAFATEAVR